MYPWQLLIGFLPNHDSSQVSSVGGQTEETKDCPKIHQQATSPALWRLDGYCSSKENSVAHVKGRGEREDAVAIASTRRHPKGAVPLVQGEEDGSDMQGDKDAEPHGPMEGPHEGANGCSRVTGTNLDSMDGRKCKTVLNIMSVEIAFNLCFKNFFVSDFQTVQYSGFVIPFSIFKPLMTYSTSTNTYCDCYCFIIVEVCVLLCLNMKNT